MSTPSESRSPSQSKKAKTSPAKRNARKGKGSPTSTTILPDRTQLGTDAASFVRPRGLDDTAGLSKEQLHDIYRYLYETRRLEEHIVALSRQSKVVGGVYRSLGQEATAVGCAYGLRTGDFLQPLIRDLGSALVHGVSPIAMLRQYMAKGTGPSGGRDLNTHFSDPYVGILGPVSMLGAMVPVVTGCLIAAAHKKENKAGLAFIGDGGSSTGAFYEGLNFAAVKKLPLIIVIESNHYAYSTPTTEQVPDGNIVRRAIGFGCAVTHVDGNDVLACFEATQAARARGLRGEGPTIIVSETYRRRGHAEHDNQKYVPDNEIDDWAENNDPVHRYTQFLLDGSHATQQELDAVSSRIEEELNAARELAVDETLPDPATVTHGVFADGTTPWPATETWFRGGSALRPAELADVEEN